MYCSHVFLLTFLDSIHIGCTVESFNYIIDIYNIVTCVQVSSLGDEMYYTIDCEGGPGGVAGAGAVVGRLARLTFKHQHSLESYQLYKVL